MTQIIMQEPLFDGGYCSELIAGRYQVLESRTAKCFVIFDHQDGILMRNKKGDFFETYDNANAARLFIGAGAIVTKPKKNRLVRQPNGVVFKEKAPAYVKKGRKESALSYMKELLSTHGNTSDVDIAAMIKQRFPASNYNASMVKFNRKKLG